MVPCFILWGIWRYINKIFFENVAHNVDSLCLRIVKAINEVYVSANGQNFTQILNPIYFGHNPIHFFNGVAIGSSSGVGLVLKLNNFDFFKSYLVIGSTQI